MRRLLLGTVTRPRAWSSSRCVSGAAKSDSSAVGTYRIEFDNAFGLVTGADFKVAGVRAGTIESIASSDVRRGDTVTATRWSRSRSPKADSARSAPTLSASRARSR